MNKKVLNVLEFNKIRKALSEYTFSPNAVELCLKLEPYHNKDEVKMLQKETGEAVRLVKSGIYPPLEGIRDIQNSLRLANLGAVLSPKELLDIASTLRTSRLTKSLWKSKHIDGSPVIENIICKLQSFQSLEEKIFKSILNEDEIADEASEKLRSIRKNKKNVVYQIRQKLDSIVTSPKYQKMLQEPIVTVRKDRFVIPVKQESRSGIKGVIHDQSASGATIYIEPMPVVHLNNTLSQLEIEEKREVERILSELTSRIRENHDFIMTTFEGLVKLDFIFARARYALDINGVEPKFNDSGYINIIEGRHPLLRGDVVPIDVFLGDEFTVLVITGPNTGGKTVSLKTVGLLTLMAQSGLFVPAREGTEFSVFEEIFADIGDEQSIEQSLSTFSSHMKNIREITEKATPNSLILLDELGAGTDPTEGAALAMALLNYFYEKGSRVIATTHYSELKTFAHTKEGIQNASVEFDVRTLSPTYRLTIGIPGKSNAFEIAEKLGISEDIINTAKTLVSEDNLKIEELLEHIEQEKNIAEEEKQELQALKQSYYNKLQKLEAQKRDIEKQQERILESARQKARLLISKTKRESELMIERLKEIEFNDTKSIRDRTIEATRAQLKDMDRELMGEREPILKPAKQKKDEPLKPGEKVRIEGLNQEGYIIDIDCQQKSSLVQVGIMKLNVPLESLCKIRDEKEQKQQIQSNKYTNIALKKTEDISTELDVRGLTLDEALLRVDKYLDDAYMAGISVITIIHGKGTGVLRKGIQDMLRNEENIKSFRLGRIDEGGSGVTVVEFK